jgi:hypothetical protein
MKTILTSTIKILFGLILLATSCSYKVTAITDTNGKKDHVRVYKKIEDQDVYNEKSVFARQYHPKTYSRYIGSISLITIDSFPYVQFDSVRVGFGKDARKFIEIFSSGLLNSKIIYCTQDSLCRTPTAIQLTEVASGKVIKPHIGDWYGDIINVGLIEEPGHLKESPQKRRFKLWISTTYGEHGYSVYFIELTNNKVDKYVDIHEFIKNASLTFIITPWSII